MTVLIQMYAYFCLPCSSPPLLPQALIHSGPAPGTRIIPDSYAQDIHDIATMEHGLCHRMLL